LIPFPFNANSHIQAVLKDAAGVETTWVETIDYSLTGAGNPAGGTVTATTAPVSGTTLAILRIVPETQATDYPDGGAFPSGSHEQALDKLTMLIQQHSEEIARALVLPASSTSTGFAAPEPVASKFLRWNAAADKLEYVEIVSTGGLGIPVAIPDGGTGGTTAGGARTNLGLGSAATKNTGTAAGDVPTTADADGRYLAQGKHTVWIPATAMHARTSNGVSGGNRELATNKIGVRSFDFDATADEFVQFVAAMPKSWNEGTVTAQFVWTAASGSGDVVWGLQAVAIGDDDALDVAFGTAQTVTDTLIVADDEHLTAETSAVTVGGTPAENDLVIFQVYRDADAAGDTLAVDASLVGVKLFVTLNAGDDA
jgi:hypothetical protein